mgnify:CR=1 FL=1
MLVKAYLVVYNVLQTVGCVCGWKGDKKRLFYSWLIVLCKTLVGISESKRPESIYADVLFAIGIAQTAALLEVLHVVTKLVRTSVFMTFLQVSTRLFNLWAVAYVMTNVR